MALKKDPAPGGPTTDGSIIYTDQHNEIVDRLGGEADLTANRALATDANGDIEVQTTTKTELGHVSGVTSAIQTQLDAKAATSHNHAASDINSGTLAHERGGLEADVSAYSGLLAVSGGTTSEVDSKAELEAQLADVSDIAEADGDTYTGIHDFGGATSLEIPNGATPTVDATGEIAVDTTITNYTGMIKYHDGTEELTVLAVPTANLSTTDGHVVAYNATNNELEMVAQSGGGAGGGDGIIQTVVKDTDETQNSNTTVTKDAQLFVNSLEPGEYYVSIRAYIQSGATPDFRFTIDGDGTLSGNYIYGAWTSSAPTTTRTISQVSGIITDGNVQVVTIDARVIITATSSIEFQWAQNTSDAGNTTVLEGSSLMVIKEGVTGAHTIQDEGSGLAAQANLNFVGAGVTVTDDAVNNATKVTISGSAGNEFDDSLFRIQDNLDATKEIAFQASGITTGTTRTVTMPDTDVDLSNLAKTTDNLSVFASTTSAQLGGVISDETGTGSLVFSSSPVLTTPNIGTPSAGVLTNCTGLPTAGILDDNVTYAKIQNVSQTDVLLGRDTAGAGIIEEITPANVRTMINVADGANNYSHPDHTGDVTSTGDGPTAIAAGVIVDADVNASAAIAYSKLNLATSIVDGDLSTTSDVVIKPVIVRFDGGGSALTANTKVDIPIDFNGTIEQVTMLSEETGSAVVDIWKDTYANFPPTDADSITASAVPTISSSNKSQDATLTGWTTTVSAGDTLRFNVDSATTIEHLTIALKVRAT